MADFTLTDIERGAQNNVQVGITPALYFFNQSDVDTITLDATTREVEAITLKTSKEAYKVVINNDEAFADWEEGGGATTYGTQTLNFSIDGLTSATMKALMPYKKATGLCVLAVLANGTRRLLGIDCDITDADDNWLFAAKMNGANTSKSGAINDSSDTVVNSNKLIFVWKTHNEPLFVETALSLATLTTPVS